MDTDRNDANPSQLDKRARSEGLMRPVDCSRPLILCTLFGCFPPFSPPADDSGFTMFLVLPYPGMSAIRLWYQPLLFLHLNTLYFTYIGRLSNTRFARWIEDPNYLTCDGDTAY